MPQPLSAPPWLKTVLFWAGVYNLAWGAWVVAFPRLSYTLSGLVPLPLADVQLWQCIGMIVGVYGVGYMAAAADPVRHWPVVLVGFLGKVFGPVGFVDAALRGDLPWAFGLHNVTNDVIWWVPFYLILRLAYRNFMDEAEAERLSLAEAMDRARDQHGKSLAELSKAGPVLTLFLRHFGCPFCREALADVAERREKLRAEGVGVAVVHMGTDAEAVAVFTQYGLADDAVSRISDPEANLYRAFGLRRGNLWQLFGPYVTFRVLTGAGFSKYKLGPRVGDITRLQGAFLVRDGQILNAHRNITQADRPDYDSLMTCPVPARG
jgi:peroxiredoxin